MSGEAAEAPIHILFVEDSALDAELILSQLRRGGVEATWRQVADRPGFEVALGEGAYDLILSDYSLPGFDGLEALAIARERAPQTPFIFISGVMGEERAVETLKQGAVDYIVKQRLARLPAAVRRALAEARERAERVRAEERGALLVAELSHRVKNTLATVVSVATLTLKRSETLADFERAFFGRLNALAEANGLIFEANWRETDIRRVLERTLRPFARDGAALVLDGPLLPLPPKPAVALSLIFHELGTNATKYGALTREGGRVHVSWTVEPDTPRWVRLVWRETGGPPIHANPTRTGFGSTLIARSLRYELDGRATIAYPLEGLICELAFPGEWAAEPIEPPRLA